MTEIIALDKQEELLNNELQVKQQLRMSKEVHQLVKKIDITDQVSLLEIGLEPATQISDFSGRVLNTMKSASVEESSELIKQLLKIMNKFEPKDFVDDKKGLAKVFGRGKKVIEKAMAKYQTMGSEIDKVYIEIKKYEADMKYSTTMLEQLYTENYGFFMELEKYIVAVELKVEELKTEVIPPLEQRVQAGDQVAGVELDTVNNALELLEQRGYDLEMAKQVAFQTAPQIRLIQRGNTKLIAKINSAFVTTIPVFKNSLIQAVAIKRQALVAESMEALDATTNEMLIRNATQISENSTKIARMAGAPSIKLETMEETWSIIMAGMQETRAIEDENARNREAGKARLQELQQKYEHDKQTKRI